MQGFTLHHMYKSGTSRLIYDPIWAARVIFKKIPNSFHFWDYHGGPKTYLPSPVHFT